MAPQRKMLCRYDSDGCTNAGCMFVHENHESAAYKWQACRRSEIDKQRQEKQNTRGRASSNARQTQPTQQLGQSQKQQQENAVKQFMTNLNQSQNPNQQQKQQKFCPNARVRSSSNSRQTKPKDESPSELKSLVESLTKDLANLTKVVLMQQRRQIQDTLPASVFTGASSSTSAGASSPADDSSGAPAGAPADATADATADAQVL